MLGNHFMLLIIFGLLSFCFGDTHLSSSEYEALLLEAYEHAAIERQKLESEMFLAGAQSVSGVHSRKRFIRLSKESRLISESYRRDMDAANYIAEKHALTLEQAARIVLRYKRDDGSNCTQAVPTCDPTYKYRSIDGTCNNLMQPLLGSANTPPARIVPAAYTNGTEPRGGLTDSTLPNPRFISTTFSPDVNVPNNLVTHMITVFAQTVAHDFALLGPEPFPSCCNGQISSGGLPCFNILIPPTDPFFNGKTCMDFTRSAAYCLTDTVTREQVNSNTHFLDGSVIYASNNVLTKQLRSTTRTGELLLSTKYPNMMPTETEVPGFDTTSQFGIFVSGDIRVNMVPELTAFITVWVLEHNNIASITANLNPDWDDETVYQESRRIVVAEFQSIAYNEFLPAILGVDNIIGLDSTSISSYDPSVNPSIINSFATGSYRLHTLIQGTIDKYLNGSSQGTFLLRNNYFDPVPELTADNGLGLQMMLEGLLEQPTQDFDRYFSEDLTNFLFSNFIKQNFDSNIMNNKDMVAIDIQRGRDHGIPAYYLFRKVCNLSPIQSWDTNPPEITSDMWSLLQTIYTDPFDIDLIIGGSAETKLPNAIVGATFSCLIIQQFQYLKSGDRFFFSHTGQVGSFSNDQVELLVQRKLRDVLCDNSNITNIQQSAFYKISDSNPLTPCNSQSNSATVKFVTALLNTEGETNNNPGCCSWSRRRK